MKNNLLKEIILPCFWLIFFIASPGKNAGKKYLHKDVNEVKYKLDYFHLNTRTDSARTLLC